MLRFIRILVAGAVAGLIASSLTGSFLAGFVATVMVAILFIATDSYFARADDERP